VLDQILSAISDCAIFTDTSGYTLAINDHTLKFLDHTSEELIGKHISEYYRVHLLDDLSQPGTSSLTRALEQQRQIKSERALYLHLRNGRLHAIEETALPLYTNSGTLLGGLVLFKGITTRQEIEKQILFQASLLDQVNSSVVATDLNYRIIYWNRGAEAVYGWKAEEVLGRNIRLIVPRHNFSNADSLRLQVERQKSWNGEIELQRKDGTVILGYATNTVINDYEGKPVGYVGVSIDISELKETREQLEHSLSILKSTIESTVNGILVVDLHGTVLAFNQRFIQLWKVPPEFSNEPKDGELLKNALDQVTDPEEFVARIEYLYDHPEEESTDTIHLKDQRVFERFSTPQRLTTGEIIGRVWSFRDITLERYQQEKLKEQERTFRLLFSGNPHPMWVLEATTLRFLEVNEAAIQHYGYSREEFLSLSLHDIQRYSDLSHIPSFVHSYKEFISGEWIHITKSGLMLCAELIYQQLGFNSTSAYLVVAQDITERKRIQNALEYNEKRFRALIENSSDIMLVVDRSGTILFTGHSTERQLGYPLHELIGRNSLEFIHPDDVPMATEKLTIVASEPMATVSSELRVRHKHGHWLWWEGVATNLTHDPSIQGIVANFHDITERKQIEEQLIKAKESAEEMNRLKTTFLANMSHEIRTPMTAILGFSSLIKEKTADREIESFAATIEKSGTRLLNTINGILDLAKVESNKIDLNITSHPLTTEVERIIYLLNQIAQTKQLSLRLIVEQNVSVLIDSHYFGQVMTNILGNAIKFTDRGGITVTIRTMEREGLQWGVIKVRDTGVGISPEFLPYIFDEFKQESAGYQRSFEGSGLGLTISKRLLTLMGGMIEVDSVKGQGTTFTVYVPLDGKRPNPQSMTLAKDSTSNFQVVSDKRPSVLLVEDMIETAEMVKYFLRSVANLTVASDAAQAQKAIAANTYDLILMDINLGFGLSGLDLTQQIRTSSVYPNVPIIALTAYAMKGDRETAINAGCTDYLSKPFTKDQLLEVIQRYL